MMINHHTSNLQAKAISSGYEYCSIRLFDQMPQLLFFAVCFSAATVVLKGGYYSRTGFISLGS